ncbi:MAG: hypothetical protein AB1644_11260 [Candidatus Zixiibacteriota bacterium]
MEHPLHYNFKDVMAAPARALAAKQIGVMTLFLCGALIKFDFFFYLAYWIQGEDLATAFSVWGLLPFTGNIFGNIVSQIVYYGGIVAALLVVMFGFFAVAAINIEAVRGNHFFGMWGAIKFALSRWKQLLLSELSIALFVAFIVLLFFLLGLASRIPIVGEWIFTVLFVIPNFVIALFSVFILFVFILTVLLLPAVAAAERNGETFNVILETFSTIIRQPFRWAGFTLYAVVAAKVCSFIYAYFAYRAVQFLVWTSSLGGGDNLEKLVRSGLSHLPVRSQIVNETLRLFPGLKFGVTLPSSGYFVSQSAAGHVMAFMLFLIFASILGYLLAVVAAGQARGYVVIRCLKDGHKISEEQPLFFKDEHVNPKVEGEDACA